MLHSSAGLRSLPGDHPGPLRISIFSPSWRNLQSWRAPYGLTDGTCRGAGEEVTIRPLLLRLEWIHGGPEIDVICATRPWERAILDRAVQVTLPGGRRVPVVTPEDLIVLKLLAGGPQDLIDVTDLLTRCGTMPELDERATERGVVDLLQRVRETIRLDRRGLTDY